MSDDGFVADSTSSNDGFMPDKGGLSGSLPPEINDKNKWLAVIRQATTTALPSKDALLPIQPTSSNAGMAAIQAAVQTLRDPSRISPTMSAPGQVAGDAVSNGLQSNGVNPLLSKGAGLATSMALDPQTYVLGGLANKPVQETFEKAAQSSGRRALGFTKKFLNTQGGVDRANEAAQTMLDQGVITPFASTDQIQVNVKNILNKSGSAIKKAVDEATDSGAKSFHPKDAIKEITNQLAPKYAGGEYDRQLNIVNDIINTIKGHGNTPLNFSSAQDLKQTLQSVAKFHIDSEPTRASLFGRASGIVRQMLDDSLDQAVKEGKVNSETALNYIANKPLYSKAKGVINPITGKLAAEAGNDAIDLKSMLGATGALAAGHPLIAAGLAGLNSSGVISRGQSAMASFLNSLSKSGYTKLVTSLMAGAGNQGVQLLGKKLEAAQ